VHLKKGRAKYNEKECWAQEEFNPSKPYSSDPNLNATLGNRNGRKRKHTTGGGKGKYRVAKGQEGHSRRKKVWA